MCGVLAEVVGWVNRFLVIDRWSGVRSVGGFTRWIMWDRRMIHMRIMGMENVGVVSFYPELCCGC